MPFLKNSGKDTKQYATGNHFQKNYFKIKISTKQHANRKNFITFALVFFWINLINFIMKKYFSIIILSCVMLCLSGCAKFEPAIIDLSVTPMPVSSETMWLDCKGTVTDNGGCKYFNEMGFLFSFTPDPVYKAEDVYTVAVEENIETPTFDLTYTNVMIDTVYFVRAYVCTNAGTGYSETKTISTHITPPTSEE